MKDNTVPLTLISLLADGEFHSGEQLGETLGMSRAAINKHVQTLRDWGVDVFNINRPGAGAVVGNGFHRLVPTFTSQCSGGWNKDRPPRLA